MHSHITEGVHDLIDTLIRLALSTKFIKLFIGDSYRYAPANDPSTHAHVHSKLAYMFLKIILSSLYCLIKKPLKRNRGNSIFE